jgi:hypothetical protein
MVVMAILNVFFAVLVVGAVLGLLIASVVRDGAMAHRLSVRQRHQPRVRVARARRGQSARVPEFGVR